MLQMSDLQKLRLKHTLKLPRVLESLSELQIVPGKSKEDIQSPSPLANQFPHLKNQDPFVTFEKRAGLQHSAKKVGVVLSGGQAAGGHNVITGLYDALQKMNQNSILIGFIDGPKGIIENKTIELTAEKLALYRNQGGFDLLGSGRTKIETPEQFAAAAKAASEHGLDGLVIIGGDDSNTNAAFLAEYFKAIDCKTAVIGVPKTIDGDLANADIAISFGFDSATKTYSEVIGNILRDNLSAKKYYYFIKLMGRSASHIALECALKTQPNLTLISEEIAAQNKTLQQITKDICDMICERADQGKDFGTVLIPEGIIEFIPEFKQLIDELNILLAAHKLHAEAVTLLKTKEEKVSYIQSLLSPESNKCFRSIPQETQLQLLMDRDPHGNVQVSRVETESLFIQTVQTELNKRKKLGNYKGKFSPQAYFCGYEGRSCLPSNFDAQYCYALGYVAALLLEGGATGYICCVQELSKPVEEWKIGGRSLVTMMQMEKRNGKEKPVISKFLVDLKGRPFEQFQSHRKRWMIEDDYIQPGPIQFFGPTEVTDNIPIIIS